MPTNFLSGVTPVEMGMPDKFPAYRDVQREIAEFVLLGPHGDGSALRRFRCVGAPPGSGKSLAEVTVAEMTEGSVVILTATRALEDQMVGDNFDLVNIRGRSNYECTDFTPGTTARWSCEEGDDKDCKWSGTSRCTYTAKVEEARRKKIVVTNYQYWMNARSFNSGALEVPGKPIKMLIADEAHLVPEELARYLKVYVSNYDLHSFARKEIREAQGRTTDAWGFVTEKWLEALGTMIGRIDARMADIASDYESLKAAAKNSKEYRRLDKLTHGLNRLVRISANEMNEETKNWLWREEEHGLSFECVWPKRYAERYLWSGVETVVLLSATLRPKAMQLLGIKRDEMHYREWPRQFSALRSPVYWLKTGKMGHKTDAEEKGRAVEQGERIWEVWKEFKGLVHTASYTRAEWLQAASSWGRYMMLNKRGESAAEEAERFRKRTAPAALVSPSYTTGYDFSNEAARWNWVLKLPFPDRSDPVVQARCATDEDYYNYVTAQTIVQACGRAMRNEKDWGVTLITDDAIGRFRHYARDHFPAWFKVLDVPGEPPWSKKPEMKQVVPGIPAVVKRELGL